MKKSSFAKFHAKQGIVLIIASIIYSIALQIILGVIIIPLLFAGLWIGLGIFGLLYYVPLIWMIIGIINALNGKEKELPIIGKYASKFGF
jgi:uncharacterized membrane protein